VASLSASVLILTVGWDRIQSKVRERPTIRDDAILTVDELANLPPATLRAVMPRSGDSGPGSLGYRILELCLEKSGEPFVLGYGASVTDQEGSVQRIAASTLPSKANPTGLTVGLFGVGREISDRLKPIPIPVMGGLLGLRVAWINRQRIDRFAAVRSLADLDQAVAIQGSGWSDAAILEESGIRTYTTATDRILALLSQDRVDLYPRGIPELQDDHERIRRSHPDVALEPHLLIAYPFAVMFHVHPDNERLRAAIQRGFERAFSDGSYHRLLHNGVMTPWLSRSLDLPRRRVIALPNRDDAALMAAVESRYWLVPWQRISQGRISRGEELCRGGIGLQPLCGEPGWFRR
jgi:hypothetical protein